MHLGSLESTQEARVALGDRLVQLFNTHLSCSLNDSPNFPSASITLLTVGRSKGLCSQGTITRHAKHEKILNFHLGVTAADLDRSTVLMSLSAFTFNNC